MTKVWFKNRATRAVRRGSLLLELSIGLALFGLLSVLVTQMLVARDRTEQRLEREARRMQQAQGLMERLFHLAPEQLDPDTVEGVIEHQMSRWAPDPYFRPDDGAWRVALEPQEHPLPGVKIVVRFHPANDSSEPLSPVTLVAWRYFLPSPGEVTD
jgi:hypothetical protein